MAGRTEHEKAKEGTSMTEWEDFINAVNYGRELHARESTPTAVFLLLGIFIGFVGGWVVYGL